MGLFRRRDLTAAIPVSLTAPPSIASPWADPNVLRQLTLDDLLGLVPDDQLPFVTRDSAVALPPIARGRDLIAVTCGRLPLVAYNGSGRLDPAPAVLLQPEPGRPRVTTMTWTVDDMLFHGVAYWQIIDRDAANKPRRFRWLPWRLCEHDDAGQLATFAGQRVDLASVIRFDGPHEGVCTRGRRAVRDARRLARSFSRQTDNPVPTVELHNTGQQDLTDDQIDSLIAGWVKARSGATGGVGYTNSAVELKTHGQPPEQMMNAGLTRSDLDLARVLGLPAWAVDAQTSGSSLTYSNVPSRSRELIDYTLSGYLDAIAGRLSLDDVLPHGTWCAFDTDPLTDGDFGERMTAGKTAIDAKIYTPEQIRAREQGIPVENSGADA